MNLKRKTENAISELHIKLLAARRDELKGRYCRHVKTFRIYCVQAVSVAGCWLAKESGKGVLGPNRYKTWKQFAKLYNLMPEDRGDAV